MKLLCYKRKIDELEEEVKTFPYAIAMTVLKKKMNPMKELNKKCVHST